MAAIGLYRKSVPILSFSDVYNNERSSRPQLGLEVGGRVLERNMALYGGSKTLKARRGFPLKSGEVRRV